MIRPIFVFGSNLAGIHGAGAAKYAKEKYGAEWGVGVGLTGQSYALPTKDFKVKSLSVDEISVHVKDFIEFARNNPKMLFVLTPIGLGLAGNKPKSIVDLFLQNDIHSVSNIVLTSTWLDHF
jgi:hypothetical protein